MSVVGGRQDVAGGVAVEVLGVIFEVLLVAGKLDDFVVDSP